MSTIVTIWLIVGFAGGLRWSRNAYTAKGVIGTAFVGAALGPFSFLFSFKE